PAVKPQRGPAFDGRVQQCLVDRHVMRSVGNGGRQQAAHYAFHRRMGSLAAWTSSGRLIGSVCGASCRTEASSSQIFKSASAKASKVSLLSVSVGSIISASRTTSGK